MPTDENYKYLLDYDGDYGLSEYTCDYIAYGYYSPVYGTEILVVSGNGIFNGHVYFTYMITIIDLNPLATFYPTQIGSGLGFYYGAYNGCIYKYEYEYRDEPSQDEEKSGKIRTKKLW